MGDVHSFQVFLKHPSWVGRIVHFRRHIVSLVVIPVIEQNCVFAFEGEGQTIVAVDPDRPMPLAALQPMQSPRKRGRHIGWPSCFVERGQLHPQLRGMMGLNPGFAVGLVEFFKPGMTEGPDYLLTITLHFTVIKPFELVSQVRRSGSPPHGPRPVRGTPGTSTPGPRPVRGDPGDLGHPVILG